MLNITNCHERKNISNTNTKLMKTLRNGIDAVTNDVFRSTKDMKSSNY